MWWRIGYCIMPKDKLVREPDENSGPAVAGREPIILPEQRKKAVDKVKDTLNL